VSTFKGLVYKITNKINGKCYIGKTTKTVSYRWYFHSNNFGHCIALQEAVKKYGKENFSVEEIAFYTNLEDLNNAEEYYIDFYNCLAPNGYNLTNGGSAPLHSTETKNKMSNTRQQMLAEGKMPWLPKKGEHRSIATQFKVGIEAPNKGRKKQIIDGKVRYVRIEHGW
jgi:group I intron endonuclease